MVFVPSLAMGPDCVSRWWTEVQALFAPLRILRVAEELVESSQGCHASGEEGAEPECEKPSKRSNAVFKSETEDARVLELVMGE